MERWVYGAVAVVVVVGALTALLTSHFTILTIAGIIACLALIVANIRYRSSRR